MSAWYLVDVFFGYATQSTPSSSRRATTRAAERATSRADRTKTSAKG